MRATVGFAAKMGLGDEEYPDTKAVVLADGSLRLERPAGETITFAPSVWLYVREDIDG